MITLELVNRDSLSYIAEWSMNDNFRWLSRMQRAPLTIRNLLEYLDKEFTLTYIVYEHKKPIGYARLTHYLSSAGLGIAIIEGYRDKGIGTELTNRLQVMANMMGKRECEAITLVDNKPAIAVLQKCRFLESEYRSLNPDLEVIKFTKRLG